MLYVSIICAWRSWLAVQIVYKSLSGIIAGFLHQRSFHLRISNSGFLHYNNTPWAYWYNASYHCVRVPGRLRNLTDCFFLKTYPSKRFYKKVAYNFLSVVEILLTENQPTNRGKHMTFLAVISWRLRTKCIRFGRCIVCKRVSTRLWRLNKSQVMSHDCKSSTVSATAHYTVLHSAKVLYVCELCSYEWLVTAGGSCDSMTPTSGDHDRVTPKIGQPNNAYWTKKYVNSVDCCK